MSIAALIAFAALAPGAAPPTPGASPDGIAAPPAILARIGGKLVTTAELEENLERQFRAYVERREQAVRAGLWDARQEAAFAEVRERLGAEVRAALLRSALIEDMVEGSGYRPDETLIELRVAGAARKAGGLEALAREQGRSLAEIREELRRADLERRFWRAFVPPPPEPTPAQVREYYLANRRELRSPPLARLRLIRLPSGPDRQQAFERADDLRRELQYAPDRFPDRAREHSTHRESAERGGLLAAGPGAEAPDMVSLGAIPAPLAEAAARLRPGEVSGLVELADGFYLLKLEELRPGREYALAEVCERIADLLRRAAEERTFADWVDCYMHTAYVADGRGARADPRALVAQRGGTASP